MSKFFSFLPLASFFFFLFLCSHPSMKFLGLGSIFFLKDMLPPFFFSFCVDSEMFLFFFMVSLVTSLVSLYSEFYMDHYNFKKYSFLTFSFFFSMLFLVSSNSYLNFLIGWDGLGVSSLCLIMFYPNKTSSFNSLLTFFFNRLGDLGLLTIFGFFFYDESFFVYFSSNFSPWILLLIVLCASTKGAQFPFSSWLPAAMSAPTPISAMVHSSTLVTAGIFILYKLFYFMYYCSVFALIFFLAACTFVIGGVLANSEYDLKKIVAFSTMSQISMISFFLSLGFLSISMFHMFNHALFKTLIFCSCGILFVFNSSDQFSIRVSSTKLIYYITFPFFFSVFMMTGFQFSSSFLTKDLILEILNEQVPHFIFFALIFGSILTLFYCCSLFNSFFHTSLNFKQKLLGLKFYTWNFMALVCLGMSVFGIFFSSFFSVSSLPMVTSSLVMFISFLLVFPVLFTFNFFSSFYFLNPELLFSKNFIFSKMKQITPFEMNSFFSSDQMFFKPLLISSVEKTKFLHFKFMSTFLIILFFLSVFIFF